MMTERQMKDRYHEIEFCKGHYIIGLHKGDRVHACICDRINFIECAHMDSASKSEGACLRYRQNNTLAAFIESHAHEVIDLCSIEELEALAKAYSKRANRGKAFERLVTEYFDQVWEDDNKPFWEAGDIVINGQAYQIKYDRCNFCNEAQLKGLEF